MSDSTIGRLWEEWSTRKLPDGRRFDDVFQVDGIPLWWFFYTRITATDIPRPFRRIDELEKDIESGHGRSVPERIRFRLFSLVLRAALRVNEMSKALLAGFSQKSLNTSGKPGCLFFDYVHIVKREEGKDEKIVLYKAENVRKKLEKDGRLEPVIILADRISSNGGKSLCRFDNLIYQYIDRSVRRKSRHVAKTLTHEWSRLDDDAKHALFSMGRKSAWPVIREEFDLLFSYGSLYLISKYFYAFQKAILKNKAEVAYLNALEGTYDLCLIGALNALKRGIVYSPHGMAPQGFVMRKHTVKEEMRSRVIFAMSGKEEAEQYVRRGVRKWQLRITGPMIFDDIVKYIDTAKKPHAGNVVCFFGQPMAQANFMPHETYLRHIRRILDAAKEAGARVIVKMHPRENYEDDYRRIAKELRLDAEIISQPGTKTLYSAIARSDVTISFGSTADVEALLLGKRVINITGVKGKPGEPTAFERAITLVDKDAPLAPAIKHLLTDKKMQQNLEEKRRKYIQENFYKIDGKAYERVAQLIYEACKR